MIADNQLPSAALKRAIIMAIRAIGQQE